MELQKIVGNFLDELRKQKFLAEIFSCPQVIENSRQYLLAEQIFYRKQSSGTPEVY